MVGYSVQCGNSNIDLLFYDKCTAKESFLSQQMVDISFILHSFQADFVFLLQEIKKIPFV